MHKLTEEQRNKWMAIQPLLLRIDLEKQKNPCLYGVVNRLSASTERPSHLMMKLLQLSHRGVISYDEFIAFVLHDWSIKKVNPDTPH